MLLPATASAQFETAGRPGIRIGLSGDVIVITEVIEETAAAKAELQVGDQVLRVDHTNIIGMKARRVEPMLRGPKGSKVQLTVLPRMQMVPRTVTVVRDVDDDVAGSTGAGPVDTFKALSAARHADYVLEVKVDQVTFDEDKLSRAVVVDRIHSTVDDVQQCVAAVDGFPPSDDGKFVASYSMKGKGYVGVRVAPIDVDVQVCIAAKASRWQLPQPKDPPTLIEVTYRVPPPPKVTATPDDSELP